MITSTRPDSTASPFLPPSNPPPKPSPSLDPTPQIPPTADRLAPRPVEAHRPLVKRIFDMNKVGKTNYAPRSRLYPSIRHTAPPRYVTKHHITCPCHRSSFGRACCFSSVDKLAGIKVRRGHDGPGDHPQQSSRKTLKENHPFEKNPVPDGSGGAHIHFQLGLQVAPLRHSQHFLTNSCRQRGFQCTLRQKKTRQAVDGSPTTTVDSQMERHRSAQPANAEALSRAPDFMTSTRGKAYVGLAISRPASHSRGSKVIVALMAEWSMCRWTTGNVSSNVALGDVMSGIHCPDELLWENCTAERHEAV